MWIEIQKIHPFMQIFIVQFNITFAFIVQPSFDSQDHFPTNICIKIIQITIQIQYLHRINFLDPDRDL